VSAPTEIRTYVALGDSFTAGLEPGARRWADDVAAALGPDLCYENLASVGATSEDVERDQLPRALELRPDLVSLICGANDVLLSVRPDPAAYALRLTRMVRRIRAEAPGAELVTATYPDISRFLDLRPRSRARVEAGIQQVNAACRSVARAHDVLLLEGFDHPATEERDAFADDGFHPSREGHRRAATEFVAALRRRLGATQLRRQEEATTA
jgi:phosphatidylinositol alpha 1,6-mannosyltransferase